MRVVISDNIKDITRSLNNRHKRQIPFAASQALNDVAKEARLVSNAQTDKVFEGGATGFTKRAFRYKRSNKRNLSAEVFVSDNHDYMKFMIEGGTRFPDKRAIRVSTRHSKLNKYGNFTRATVQKMINDKKKYFTGVPKGMPGAGAGVWERYGRKTKSGGQKIRMVGVFQDNAQYRPIFPFGEFVEGVVFSRNDGFAIKFRQRLEAAIRTAK